MMPIFMLLVYTAQIAIYSIGGNDIFNSINSNQAPTVSIGEISQATMYVVMICFALMQFGMMFSSMASASASAKRINAVMDCPLEKNPPVWYKNK